VKPVNELPLVATSFAFRRDYWAELDGMLPTLRGHHPDWTCVVGRGPHDGDAFVVTTPHGEERWPLPLELTPMLDGSPDDWRRITRLKGWWVHEVWRRFAAPLDTPRLLWLDADARLNGPLDFEVPAESEVVVSPWWEAPNEEPPDAGSRATEHGTLTTGMILFQGSPDGAIAGALGDWRSVCLREIASLPPNSLSWFDGDQELLTELLDARADIGQVRLDYAKYCGEVDWAGRPRPGALVDQWMMSRRMYPGGEGWPPPEHERNTRG